MTKGESGPPTGRANQAGTRNVFSLLGVNPRFRVLWIANLFFFAGVWTQTLVLGWLVYDLTGSALSVSIYAAARLAPMLFGPFGGLLSDRFDRVRLLMIASAWTFLALAVVATLVSLGDVPFWVLVVGGFAIGLGQSPSQPARSSLVLDLVGRTNLSRANALNAMAISLTQIVGPALGGAMIGALGVAATLWIAATWYAVSFLALLPLRSVVQRRQARVGSALTMLAGGFRDVLSIRLARAALFVTLAANILIWPIYQGFIPIFAADVLDLDARGLGWLMTCTGIGGLLGSLIIGSMGDFRWKGGVFVLGSAAWGFFWFAFGSSDQPALSYALMLAIGVAGSSFGVLQATLLLMTTPPAVHGRALGTQELVIGVMPFSTLMLGAIAQQIGVARTTQACGLLLMVLLVGLAVRVPELLRFGGHETAPPDERESTPLHVNGHATR